MAPNQAPRPRSRKALARRLWAAGLPSVRLRGLRWAPPWAARSARWWARVVGGVAGALGGVAAGPAKIDDPADSVPDPQEREVTRVGETQQENLRR